MQQAIWQRLLQVLLLVLAAASPACAQTSEAPPAQRTVLWLDPGDISLRNLFYGPGGKTDEPKGPMKFLKEEAGGSSPKFDVRDADGKKWRAKLSVEARPETVANRLLWAVGYFGNEDYFFAELQVADLPPKLKRGQNYVTSGGVVHNVRLQRHPEENEKRTGNWDWRQNPFYGTREYNGLRVMMALLNNWDLKTTNNAIFKDREHPGTEIYEVSDLGASFGRGGPSVSDKVGKGSLQAYERSRFISKIRPDYIDFDFPKRPPLIFLLSAPRAFCYYGHKIRWMGKHIPRADAKWIGGLLAQLSHGQIEEAFRAAGYSPQEAEAFAAAVEKRIAALNQL